MWQCYHTDEPRENQLNLQLASAFQSFIEFQLTVYLQVSVEYIADDV